MIPALQKAPLPTLRPTRRRPGAAVPLALLLGVLLACPAPAAPAAGGAWQELAPGLDLGEFALQNAPARGEASVVVLRVDPDRWQLGLHCASADSGAGNRSVRQWCEQEGLVAAINAGMFAADHRTHVGYLRCGDHVNNPREVRYQSVAAMRPRDPDDPPFRIFDLDRPGGDLDAIAAAYRDVVQNLRLIRRPGENRWSPQQKRWSEAALGEDAAGRALLIFCGGQYSMHDLNAELLRLPLDLVCAQHLDGGAAAQLAVLTGGLARTWIGSDLTDASERDPRRPARPVPFVIGVQPRDLTP